MANVEGLNMKRKKNWCMASGLEEENCRIEVRNCRVGVGLECIAGAEVICDGQNGQATNLFSGIYDSDSNS
jgi:hypothetical protein